MVATMAGQSLVARSPVSMHHEERSSHGATLFCVADYIDSMTCFERSESSRMRGTRRRGTYGYAERPLCIWAKLDWCITIDWCLCTDIEG